jgi:hypothetical protein
MPFFAHEHCLKSLNHAQSDEEVTEVTTPLTRKTGVTAPLNYVYVLENTKICTISRGAGIKQKV